jgi:fructoselysine-6-P-deglycase FrlB-like protein
MREKNKRCNININNLETRIINAINSNASNKIDDIDFNESNNCLFIGTGGSYAAAYFASKVINLLYGCNTYSIYSRDVLYINNKNIDKVVLFSYSGTTNDIISSIKDLDNKNIYIVTKGELQKIVLKTGIF